MLLYRRRRAGRPPQQSHPRHQLRRLLPPYPAGLGQLGELHIGAPFGKAPGDKAFVSQGMREAMEGDCEYYDKGSLPDNISMMVIADRIVRFEVNAPFEPGQLVTDPRAGCGGDTVLSVGGHDGPQCKKTSAGRGDQSACFSYLMAIT